MQQSHAVPTTPVLGDSVLRDAIEEHARHRYPPAGRRDAEHVAPLCTAERPAGDPPIPFGYEVLDCNPDVREGATETRQGVPEPVQSVQVPTWLMAYQVVGEARGSRFQVTLVELFEVTKDQIFVFSFRNIRLLLPECRNYLPGEMLQRGAFGRVPVGNSGHVVIARRRPRCPVPSSRSIGTRPPSR